MLYDQGETDQALDTYSFRHRIKEVVEIHVKGLERPSEDTTWDDGKKVALEAITWEEVDETKWKAAFVKNDTLGIRKFDFDDVQRNLDALDGYGQGFGDQVTSPLLQEEGAIPGLDDLL